MSIYIPFILNNFPRVFTQIDKDMHSNTYGCCDRNFWHLKIRDFSSAILQQTGLVALLMFQNSFEGNPCYGNDNVKNWAKATLDYWAKIQLSDGSFNEYYPNEHGFPPTAFSLYSACCIYKRLKLDDEKLKYHIRKTAKFVAENNEQQALNQEMASITALYCAFEILGDEYLFDRCKNKLKNLLLTQSKEGWFPEYGGADLGYLSVTLDMMAEYFLASNDSSVVEPINRMIEFIKHFVHPDGTVGGEYGSRNTTYFLPSGIEVAAQWGNETAKKLKQILFASTEEPLHFMNAIDDRYLSHYVLHSFLRALEREKLMSQKAPHEPLVDSTIDSSADPICITSQYFQECRLLSYKKDTFSLYAGMGKGGVVKSYYDKKEVYINCGYRVSYENGRIAVTNWQDPSYSAFWQDDSGYVSGNMNFISLKVPSPVLHFGLRIVAVLFGKSIIGILKKKLILKPKNTNIRFERKITVLVDCIEILDTIKSPTPINLERANNMSARHVASGKFFMLSDLLATSDTVAKNTSDINIKTTINMKTGVSEEVVEVNA